MCKLQFTAVLVLGPALLLGQGFGKIKKTVVLERKLPAAVKLPGDSFDVKATAEKPGDKLTADKLQSLVETTLVRFDSKLQINPDKPDTNIVLRVLLCEAIAKQETATALTGKNKGQQQVTGVKVNGHLQLTYQARTHAGKFVDAEPVDVKYEHEFNQVTGAVQETKKLIGKMPLIGSKHKDEGDQDPQTTDDVIQILVNQAAQRVAARLVNTDERVEVMLARGALDQTNRYADAGQWTRFVEELETMPPLPRLEDDAYRLYNIGVGDEALGYKADTPAGAKRYFEQAVVQYRKAGEANPQERYFIEPVNRIEIALEHYKQLTPPPDAAGKKDGNR